ncbi:hypothetical protein WICPIJ_001472 [Wickerhamomyces pijperi]|uniref:Uncharacterized protein n=1 Tax=Wickerhamomyces pijperi TaxID=599730 RepID=A0A9P8QBJ9_WICPI|nr:hypothetical protein WICPIJ_001472 [Wickerhamomyces pijperi]
MERSPLQVRKTANQDNIPRHTLKSHQVNPSDQERKDVEELSYSKKRQPSTPLTPSRHTYSKTVKKPNNRPSMDSLEATGGSVLLGPPVITTITSSNEQDTDVHMKEQGSPEFKGRNSDAGILRGKNLDVTQGIFNTFEYKLQKQLIIDNRENQRLRDTLVFAALEREFSSV